MTIIQLKRPHWITNGKIHVLVRGSHEPKLEEEDKPEAVFNQLVHDHDHFAFVGVETGGVTAAVDRVRSIPLFFGRDGSGSTMISDDARIVRAHVHGDWNPDGLLEMAMAGYVTGSETTIRGVYQIPAAHRLVVDGGAFELQPFDDYWCDRGEASLDDSMKSLDEIINLTFAELVENARGRTILIPLSAGLDSRLIAAKLSELRYPQIETFSYGPPGNHEARTAREVARALQLPWAFVPSAGGKQARRAFSSQERRAYWESSDGLSSIPVMTEYQAFSTLSKTQNLKEMLVVNGQSGDFISGGHVPPFLGDSSQSTLTDLFEAIVAKHYSLWNHLKTPDHLNAVRERIFTIGSQGQPERLQNGDRRALWEAWELNARQSKYVVNGQRLYDYFGADWALPLWSRHIISFFREVPFEQKLRQRLYLQYLMRWDFANVFSSIPRRNFDWPLRFKWVKAAARTAGAFRGRKAKHAAYARFQYLGAYRNQYAMFGYKAFRTTLGDARNPVSLFGRAWFEENNVPWPGFNAKEPHRKHS